MGTTQIKWQDSEGYITATYEGSGNGSAAISSSINESIDREQDITVKTTAGANPKTETVRVKQVGLREVFNASDGAFVLADGGTFNVLKVGGSTPDVPVETYTRLTYLESTGAQYIDTGYVVQEDDIIEMQYTKFVRTTVNEYMFGASDANGKIFAYISSNSIYPQFGGDSKAGFSSTRWKNVLTIQKGNISFDGTVGTLDFVSLPQVPLYIFARNNDGVADVFATIKSTGCTITKASGEVVMKLRPCKRDADGVIGMLDLVSGQFFGNRGSGADFSYGGEARVDEGYEIMDYLVCNNDKVFDTGAFGNNVTSIELLFRRTSTASADYIYGTTSGNRMTAYLTSSGYWRYGSLYASFSIKDTLLHYAMVTPTKIAYDNTSKTINATTAFNTAFTLPVCGYKPSTGVATPDFVGHIYYFRMWHNDVIVADFVPCRRLSDGVEGMWDCILQRFVEPI